MIFDITDDFCNLDFEDHEGRLIEFDTQELLDKANSLHSGFKIFPRHDNPDFELSETSVSFWKTRAPVVGIVAYFDDDWAWRELGMKCAEPRIWLPDLEASLPVHMDRTVLDKYKGLAQILEGAPW
ncbi:hypothetical protein SBOR_9815 [Sclerotinia borealis F-4128]|uniref:Uncharacterized protein n=1 Tax=Sclerotinia borealis (strain F-4128) TaxID=1432307 RepID=W9BZ18_SCLBF|nr:hypothetical protein SBOR_9815 [Sclerotinia borealis F-4128]